MNQNERFFNLDFYTTESGSVLVTQEHCGEEYGIEAHPEQLKFIVRTLYGSDEATAAEVADLERKLSILASKIDSVVTDTKFRREILNSGMASSFELIAKLDALLDLAMEFDGGRLHPEAAKAEKDEGNARSNDNISGAEQFALTPSQ